MLQIFGGRSQKFDKAEVLATHIYKYTFMTSRILVSTTAEVVIQNILEYFLGANDLLMHRKDAIKRSLQSEALLN